MQLERRELSDGSFSKHDHRELPFGEGKARKPESQLSWVVAHAPSGAAEQEEGRKPAAPRAGASPDHGKEKNGREEKTHTVHHSTLHCSQTPFPRRKAKADDFGLSAASSRHTPQAERRACAPWMPHASGGRVGALQWQ